ncbi:DNA-binding transcriptional activator of the SARP family [Streptomyces sp. Ncost-T6T-1]|uniref:AfsR/SARP family transcriptional regulator n=1 Tax=Streptomyces sp. Ncost-T6T-1 TaxID=1100828 RepID=UPI000805A2FC|nr:BTAD domain-containing putative transcriptional regulator [Streptomyces sp. Ncost-T6T-1]SBU94375.1 DNA-binding transcriptional activator of the SARP family [Streptomyces sp. Ncost-T6T-1]
MQFRVLGPVEAVDHGGEPLPVSAPMLRALLAALILRPGRPVPVEELADQLWGERLPANVRTTLRNYVMRLRRALPGDRIRTVPGGYLLAAEAEETDLGRFRSLVLRARELAPRETEEAVVLLREALALWRGAPLADLPDLPLRADQRPRLEELHLSATEECYELELALGRHETLVDEVSAAARRHRLRERLTRLLMLALHRCGRTAEALAVYQEVRRELVDELAIEPGAETRALEQAILRDDPSLALPARSAAPSRTRAGRGQGAFPPVPSVFVGRDEELARLRAQLSDASDAPAICLIDGPGGVGKSALALRAAHDVAARFPDGLCYVDLRGADPQRPPLATEDAARALLVGLGSAAEELPDDPAALLELHHTELAGRRILLVLDNAVDTAQIAPLIPVERGSAALVTSRTLLTGVEQARHCHLEVLTDTEAVTLIRTVSGRTAEPGDQAHWEELARLCGRLPLALRIIATRLASRPRWSASDWADQLRDERGRLAELVTSDLDARASLLLSIEQLADGDESDRRAAELFPLLGTAAITSYGAHTAAALGRHTAGEARDALERLTDAQIASSPRPGSYQLHDLVRAAAVGQAALLPRARSRAALEGLAAWYLGSLYGLNKPLRVVRFDRTDDGIARFPRGLRFERADEALAWVDGAMEDIVALTDQLSDAAFDDASPALADFTLEACRALETYFTFRLRWRPQEHLCGALLRTAERRGDTWSRAVALGQLGKVAGQRDDGAKGEVLLREAMGLFAQLGVWEEETNARHNLVPCLALSGRLDEAIQEARELYDDLHARPVPGRMLPSLANNLARCLRMQGRQGEAIGLLREAYTASPIDYHLAGSIAAVLGECHLENGEWEEAVRWAGRGLTHAAEELFDSYQVAGMHTTLGTALLRLGRHEEAREANARAGRLLRELNEREAASLSMRTKAHGPAPSSDSG